MTAPVKSPARPTDRHAAASVVAELAERCGRRAFAIAYDLLRNPADAEDAVQESLARLHLAYPTLRDSDAAEGWLFRCLTNLCLKQIRRRGVRTKLAHLFRREPLAPSAHFETKLRSALDRLPARQQVAVVLRHAHDYGVADIAETMGISASTAKTHLSRGLASLRKHLGEQS